MSPETVDNRNLDKVEPELRNGKMKTLVKYAGSAALLAMFMLALNPAQAAVLVQCPGDDDGDAVIDNVDSDHPNAKCMHLSAGDGFANMADGRLQYMFGFGDLTGTPPDDAVDVGILHAQIAAPTIELNQGEEFYLSLTNTGMVMRPDLFDSHTLHFHGFPNASSVFDGLPDASVSVNMGATLSYYYNIVEPGTYMYHCHVEAAEHMQMGMLGNLYVKPAQNNGPAIADPDGSGRMYTQFVYNDADPDSPAAEPGSTGYDVEMPLQVTGFDPEFHDASMNTQPLPFANMNDTYHMFNGRGYPATVQDSDHYTPDPGGDSTKDGAGVGEAQEMNATASKPNGYNSQPVSSALAQPVVEGQKLLIRVSNLSITQFYTVSVLGLPMRVVGQGGRELIDKYDTASVNLGGGEAFDVIVDTLGVTPGTYYVYITELDKLSNNTQSFGGPMTEIVVTAAN
jgi:FtsP/CotA-like multicopper oxidase with cupredoxin domain